MKALVFEAYNHFVYKDVPEPDIKKDEVLVRVKACGICGSDIHGMDGSTGRRIPPLIMGHEASGVIVKTGDQVSGWKTGDRVTFDSTVYRLDDWYTVHGHYNLSDNREVMGVSQGTYRRNGAFAEYIAIPQHILYRIPDNVTFEQAAMVEAVAVALHSLNIANIHPGCSTFVVGAGMIGILIIRLLKISGASLVAAVDRLKGRTLLALDSGADHAFVAGDEKVKEIISSLTRGRGADVSFDAAGNSQSVNIAIENTRKGGKVILVGNTAPVVELPLQKVVTGELNILGSCAICGEYETVLGLIAGGKIVIDDLIGAVVPLSDGAAWFEKLYRNEGTTGKVILVP